VSKTKRVYVALDSSIPRAPCTDAWKGELHFVVSTDDVVDGEGIARLTSGPRCVIPVPFAPAREIFFDVHGTAHKTAITLILHGTGNVPARGPSYAGWTSISSNGLTGPGPPLKIPKSDACTAQADIAMHDTINDGGGPDPLSAQSTITLRCPAANAGAG
jgi:hypothetical protein